MHHAGSPLRLVLVRHIPHKVYQYSLRLLLVWHCHVACSIFRNRLFYRAKQWVLYYAGIQIITQRNSLPVPFANLWFFEVWRISLRLSVYKFFDVDGFQLFQVGCVNVFHLFVYVFLPHMLWQLTGQGRFQAGY